MRARLWSALLTWLLSLIPESTECSCAVIRATSASNPLSLASIPGQRVQVRRVSEIPSRARTDVLDISLRWVGGGTDHVGRRGQQGRGAGPNDEGRRSLAGLLVCTVEALESSGSRRGFYTPVCPQYITIPYCMDRPNSTVRVVL